MVLIFIIGLIIISLILTYVFIIKPEYAVDSKCPLCNSEDISAVRVHPFNENTNSRLSKMRFVSIDIKCNSCDTIRKDGYIYKLNKISRCSECGSESVINEELYLWKNRLIIESSCCEKIYGVYYTYNKSLLRKLKDFYR
jgi:predicted Zn-ribbon and HTH transcriptional regulator